MNAWAIYPSLLVLLVAAAFGRGLNAPFIYDDAIAVTGNEHIRALWPPLRPLSSPPSTPVAGRPVASLSLAINYAIGGLDVRGYHVVNMVVHASAALLLFGIVRRTLRSSSLRERFGRSADALALIGAAIWAVHPLQTEPVNYITQRTESIMGLFYFLTMYAAIRALDPQQRRLWSLVAVAACALGMASKEAMVTAPVMVVLYDRAFAGRPTRARLWLYAGLASTWLVFAALLAAGPRASTVGFGHDPGAWTYLLNQGVAVVEYLRLVVWPDPLVIDYGFVRAVTLAEVLPSVLAVAVLVIATAVAVVVRPRLGFLGAWFLVTLAPASSVVPIVTEVAAERRMYLPLAGLAVAAVLGGALLLRRARGVAIALSIVVVAALVVVSRARTEVYRSPVAIWEGAVDAVPDNHRAWTNLGIALASIGRVDDAIERFQHALDIRPDSPPALYNMGNALASQGRLDEAIDCYRRTIAARPQAAEAHYNMGVALGRQNKLDDAAAAFRAALDIRPDDAETHYHLAVALRSLDRTQEAIGHARRATQADPSNPNAHYLLGVLLAGDGNVTEAAFHFSRAALLRPGWREPQRQLDKLKRP